MKKTTLLSIVLGLVVVVVGITVAYAALSTTLNITTSKITQSALTWDVGFVGNSATATVGGTSATGRSCGAATITSTTVTIADTTLSKPDDSCTYTLSVKNNGTIPAKLGSISATAPSGVTCETVDGPTLICGNITYKLATNNTGTTVLPTNTTLAVNGTQQIFLIVKYTGSEPSSTAVTQSGASFSLVYNQN